MKQHHNVRHLSATVKLLALLVTMVVTTSASAIVSFTAVGTTVNPNNFAGLRIGNDFSVGGNGITITHLGVFDSFSNGLINSHAARLFVLSADNTGVEVRNVTVGAGTVGILDGVGANGGFRYAELAAPIFLAPGTRAAVVAYNLFGVTGTNDDPYGDNAGDPTGNVTWFGHNRYDFDTNSTLLPTYRGSDGNRHAAASFLYFNGAIPEPTSATLGLLGLGSFLLRRRRVA